MIEIDPRPLTSGERSVLRVIYGALPASQRGPLVAQLDSLVVTATWAADSASVEIRPVEGAEVTPVGIDDGILPVRAVAYDGDDVIGEILVWITGGVLSGIEYAYYLGDTPSELPMPEQIRFA
jgi:hypothetical protein